jgi:hypothetical protein
LQAVGVSLNRGGQGGHIDFTGRFRAGFGGGELVFRQAQPGINSTATDLKAAGGFGFTAAGTHVLNHPLAKVNAVAYGLS